MRVQYVLQEIAQGLRRNLTMVIAVIVSTAVALVMMGSGLLMWQQTLHMQDYWYGKVEVSVFMCNQEDIGKYANCQTAITDPEKTTIHDTLLKTPHVQTVTYENQQQAFSHYQQLQAGSVLAQDVTPNDLQDSYRVKLDNPTNASVVAGAVEGLPGVQSVQDEQQLLKPLFTFIHIAEYTAAGVAAVMLVLAFLLIFNTVRLSAFSRRRETGIMRLVGASNFYIQMPFLLEGAVAGLAGGLFASVILVGVKAFFINHVVAPHLTSVQFIGWSPFVWIVPMLLIVGVLMSVLASAFTLRKYLRV
ncbi:MAG TPA: permease-like cell division protein FtsX [Actinocrinis sp.]|nr:permease-like cell division protein FtsX [Actinocrinis sp.]